MASPDPVDNDLVARLTGVRSSKPSYYRQYRHTAESLDRSIRALESASVLLSRVPAGPEQLVDGFVDAAAGIFDAPWAVLLAEHPAFAAEHHVAAAAVEGGNHRPVPRAAERFLRLVASDPVAAAGPSPDWLAVSLAWDDNGGRGWLATGLPIEREADDTDRALLSTLGHQLVAAVRSAYLLVQAEQLRAEAGNVRRELARVREQELVERERQRIARDLHDTVAQQVLGIGMKLEWCRRAVEGDAAVGGAPGQVEEQLVEARELARATVGRIRTTIAELTSDLPSRTGGLTAALREVVAEFGHRGPELVWREPAGLPAIPASSERAVVMVVREAVANAVVHARATQVLVGVDCGKDRLVVTVSDDGCGDPAALQTQLRDAIRTSGGGYHRGLANVYARVVEVGGSLAIEPAPSGGIQIAVAVPTDAHLVSG